MTTDLERSLEYEKLDAEQKELINSFFNTKNEKIKSLIKRELGKELTNAFLVKEISTVDIKDELISGIHYISVRSDYCMDTIGKEVINILGRERTKALLNVVYPIPRKQRTPKEETTTKAQKAKKEE